MSIDNDDKNPDSPEQIFGHIESETTLTRNFLITNNYGERVIPLSSESTEDAFNFVDLPESIGAGASAQFEIGFTAGIQDADTAISITTNQRDPDDVYVFGLRGLVHRPILAVAGKPGFSGGYTPIMSGDSSPAVDDGTDFGEIANHGSSETNHFEISNSGTLPLVITAQSFTVADADEFEVRQFPDLPITIAPGDDETFRINWEPTSAGTSDAEFRLSSNMSGPAFTFALCGQASAGADIEVDVMRPGSNSFFRIADRDPATETLETSDHGSVFLGGQSERTYRVTNTGFGTLSVSEMSSSNPRFSIVRDFTTISRGDSGLFTITFNPLSTGGAESTITLINNDPDEENPYQFLATGLGEDDSAGEIVVASEVSDSIPPSATASLRHGSAFGDVLIGSSVDHHFTLRNVGAGLLSVTGDSLDDTTHFQVSGLPGGTTLQPGGEIEITVTYDPSAVGSHSAVLQIDDDDPDAGVDGSESPYVINLSGNGVTSVPVIEMKGGTPAEIIPHRAAASVQYGTMSPPVEGSGPVTVTRSFSLFNRGTAPLSITSVNTGSPFSFSPGILLSDISPGGTAEVHITADTGFSQPGGIYRVPFTLLSNDGANWNFTFKLAIEVIRPMARILSITDTGDDLELLLDLPEIQSFRITESPDLSEGSWETLSGHDVVFGQPLPFTRVLLGKEIPPLSGHLFFRLE